MIAMQYRFDFPDSMDMASIHRRVADKGPSFDGLAGLEQKAFLVADTALGQRNRYAPFYLWRSATGMREFLLSDAFAAVCDAFGRPEVTSWTVLRHRNCDAAKAPRFATQETATLPVDAGLSSATIRGHALATAPPVAGLHSSVVALDPHGWRLTRVSLWHDAPDIVPGVDLYHVPYLATRR
ncbi:MAG: DUF4865 family protein [Luteibacter sp.]